MFKKIRDSWNSLPHQAQATVMLFAGAAFGVMQHAFSSPEACYTGPCLKGYIIAAAHAGVAAVIALYIPANIGKALPPPSNYVNDPRITG